MSKTASGASITEGEVSNRAVFFLGSYSFFEPRVERFRWMMVVDTLISCRFGIHDDQEEEGHQDEKHDGYCFGWILKLLPSQY
mmetsp:Transcript_5112/g.10309  ORF Transcript_5112/g.10309 Transcript_5112/m.10309 type:complete len:83 (-) Transcript_5112:121-369(-)